MRAVVQTPGECSPTAVASVRDYNAYQCHRVLGCVMLLTLPPMCMLARRAVVDKEPTGTGCRHTWHIPVWTAHNGISQTLQSVHGYILRHDGRQPVYGAERADRHQTRRWPPATYLFLPQSDLALPAAYGSLALPATCGEQSTERPCKACRRQQSAPSTTQTKVGPNALQTYCTQATNLQQFLVQ
jgi:hypothetical protein